MPLASTAVITEIEAEFEGDAFAPTLPASWKEISRERHTSSTGLNYSFVTYSS